MYSCARVDSTNAIDAPSRASTHIQNTDPGPPMVIAVATPARLPVPMRAANDTANAWNDEMWRAPLAVSGRSSARIAESVSRRNISRIIVNCTPRERIVKYRLHTTSTPIST